MTLFKLFTRESCPMKLVPRPVGLEAKALHLPMSRRRQEAALLEHPAADPQDPIRAPPLQYEPFETERERERERACVASESELVLSEAARLCHRRLLQPCCLHGCQRRAREVCRKWPLGPFSSCRVSLCLGLTAFTGFNPPTLRDPESIGIASGWLDVYFLDLLLGLALGVTTSAFTSCAGWS